MFITTENNIANDKYLNLTVPSANLADFVGCCFAVLDFVGGHMQKHQIIHVREVSNDILHRYVPRVDFTFGDDHVEWGSKFATQPIINIFFKT